MATKSGVQALEGLEVRSLRPSTKADALVAREEIAPKFSTLTGEKGGPRSIPSVLGIPEE
jgi:hypothetical protein